MKANELRIGNYVEKSIKSGNGRKIIDKIGCQDIVRIFEGIGNFNYEPIPITEEWLLKFGFKKAYNEWILHPCFEVKIIIYNESVYNGVMFYTRTIHADYAPIYCNNHINYIHQLQNLYHALTGEELKHDTTN
jgi:hypothetical protein